MNQISLDVLGKTLLVGLLSFGGLQTANAKDAITAKMIVLKVDGDKKTSIKDADQVKPKTTLEYGVEYKNVSNQILKDVRLNLPIPSHVSYTGKALPKPIYASTDGVNFAKAPLTRIENGKQVQVPLTEYRALQWEIKEFTPKQQIKVSAQVRVDSAE